MNIRSRPLAAICLALSAAACSEGDGTGPEPQDRLELSKTTATVYQGSLDTLRATVYGGSGAPTSARVTWTSADTLIVKVDSLGVIMGRSPGQAAVTATAGTLTGTVAVTVNADVTAPVLVSAAASKPAVDLGSSDTTITFTVSAQDAQSGLGSFAVDLQVPSTVTVPMASFVCNDTVPRTGTRSDGTWSCTIPLNRYLPSGEWRANLRVSDRGLQSTARQLTFQVSGSRPDVTAPQLTGFTLAADSVSVRDAMARVAVRFRITDAEAGVAGVQLLARASSGTGGYGCGSQVSPLHSVAQDGTRRDVDVPCEIRIPQNDPAAEWYIERVTLYDLRGNERTLLEPELRALGFKTRIKVTR